MTRLFSVWSWRDRLYAYFTAHGPAIAQSRPTFRPPFGDPVERVAPILPPGARFVGWGDQAAGTIVQLASDVQ